MIARLILLMLVLPASVARADKVDWTLLDQPGSIVLFRHANAPGVGDPAGFTLGNCSTQRNLDARGRQEAEAIGAEFAKRGIPVGRVLTSQWCRARDTAELAFPGRVVDEPAFNSFFGDRAKAQAQTSTAKRILQDWRGTGAFVVSTHQVNITELTGIWPASGEGIVVRFEDSNLRVIGRIMP